jgi:hypothetical protein
LQRKPELRPGLPEAQGSVLALTDLGRRIGVLGAMLKKMARR